METFFVRVLTAVIASPQIQELLKSLIDDAVQAVATDIKAEIGTLEAGLVESIEALPGVILGDATKNVGSLLHEITGTTDEIAGAVKGQVSPLIPTEDTIQAALAGVLSKLPGGNLLGGLFGR